MCLDILSINLVLLLDNLFKPCDVVLHCQSIGPVSDYEAYKTWNMGNGLLIITQDADEVIEIAKSLNYKARIVGKIQKEENIVMKLHSTVVQKLLRIYELHGGRRDDTKLLNELKSLNLDMYQQKQNPKQEQFIVLAEDLKPKPR